jgi:hypothetical protein
MDVGFHDKRITANVLRSSRFQFMANGNKDMIDLFQCARLQ